VLISVLLVDQPLALWIDKNLLSIQPIFLGMTHTSEVLTGFPISKYLPAFVALGIGVAIHGFTRSINTARYFYFVGLTFFFSRIVAGTVKNLFLRSRPISLLENREQTDTFFVDGGNSFPSGHTAHYWGLLLPLAILFPKYRVALLIIASILSLARVVVNHHYLGDVLASVMVSYLVCIIFKKLFIERYEIKSAYKA
jgi:membrane-associated phospholipid phosphatase